MVLHVNRRLYTFYSGCSENRNTTLGASKITLLRFIEVWSGRVSQLGLGQRWKEQRPTRMDRKDTENGKRQDVHTIKADCLYCHAVL